MRLWAHQLIERQRDSGSGGGCPIATLGSGLADMDGETLTQIARIFRRTEDTIRAGYRTMQANNEIAPDADPDALATMTLATTIGGLVLAQLNRDTQALQVAVDALLAQLGAPARMPHQILWERASLDCRIPKTVSTVPCMPSDMSGSIALVTDWMSGIGTAIATTLAQRGAQCNRLRARRRAGREGGHRHPRRRWALGFRGRRSRRGRQSG